ncbi:NAD(P)H-dependent oxidoreductase [Prosthecobacter sp.]|uniref:NADPH-dependent FMN reductase n=1 Tax=Prosthecobacter sp. TaxID=1965333 RepID=UPI001DABB9A0|nr:NAD(P)H-dependent oxidoreductase [Prosthecobacter sp.]MCB1277124.1 NAD(P)H-dependent oxidoreductase [Prosthecobacter sp.]
MSAPKILAFAGSTRTASFNKLLVRFAADAARAAGAEVTVVDLRDYPLPLFDGDMEDHEGIPENGKKLKTLFREHDGFLIASPEYNSSITAVLKNTLDWVSRSETDDEPALIAYRGKAAALLSASPGALGGLRGLVHVRAILGNMGVVVLPEQAAVPKAHEAFDVGGRLKDERTARQVTGAAKSLAEFLKKFVG